MNTWQKIKALDSKSKKEIALFAGLFIFVFALVMLMGFLSGNWN